jgi:hypothetical protein
MQVNMMGGASKKQDSNNTPTRVEGGGEASKKKHIEEEEEGKAKTARSPPQMFARTWVGWGPALYAMHKEVSQGRQARRVLMNRYYRKTKDPSTYRGRVEE